VFYILLDLKEREVNPFSSTGDIGFFFNWSFAERIYKEQKNCVAGLIQVISDVCAEIIGIFTFSKYNLVSEPCTVSCTVHTFHPWTLCNRVLAYCNESHSP
jgi:hypothetical protein